MAINYEDIERRLITALSLLEWLKQHECKTTDDKSFPVDKPVILQGELLPCPFCGNEAELIEKGNNYTKKRYITIKCRNKNCRAEMTNGAIRNDMDWLRNISTNAWNKRAGREPQSK